MKGLEDSNKKRGANPDQKCNQNFKNMLILATCRTALFNKCLRSGKLPAQCRYAVDCQTSNSP